MPINAAAYQKVGLGCIPEDLKREMLEKKPDPTEEWRLSKSREKTTLSPEDQRRVGMHLSLRESYDQNSEAEPDFSVLANNPWFKRFGEVLEQIEAHIENDMDFEHLIDELEDMEESISEAGFSPLEEKFVRRKRGGALKAAARAFKKWVRGHRMQYMKKLRQGKRWAKGHKSRIKRMAKTARKGFRRVMSSADAERDESFTGRMESISDSHLDMVEQRRLAGITPSQPNAVFSTSVMDGRRPTKPLNEAVSQDLATFRRLTGR
jgi:hypothetical protein